MGQMRQNLILFWIKNAKKKESYIILDKFLNQKENIERIKWRKFSSF